MNELNDGGIEKAKAFTLLLQAIVQVKETRLI